MNSQNYQIQNNTSKKPLILGMIFLVVGILWYGFSPIAGYDIWWHLAMARESLSNHSLLPTDTFSYTVYGKTWAYKDLGASFIEYFFWKLGGAGGIVFLKGFIFVTVVFIYFYILLKIRQVSIFTGLLFLTLMAASSAFRFAERPQIFSFLCLALTLLFIEQHRIKRISIYWVLLPILLNANLHRGALILPLFVGAYVFSNLITDFKNKQKPNYSLIIISLLSIIVLFINPFGINILTTSFTMIFSESFRSSIPEWQSPSLKYILVASPAFLILLGFVLISLFNFNKENKLQNKLWGSFLLILGTLLSVRAIRFLPYFAFASILPASNMLDQYKIVQNKLINKYAFIIPFLFLIFQLKSPFFPHFGIEKRRYPDNAVKFIKKHKIKGRVLNEFRYGGYLMFFLPKYKIYSDGRNDLIYPIKIRKNTIHIFENKKLFENEVKKYNINWIFIKNTPDFTSRAFLDYSKEWVLVYISERALIYVKKSMKNQELLKKAYVFLKPHNLTTSLFSSFENHKQKEFLKEAIRFVKTDPNSIIAHKLLAKFFLLSKDKHRYQAEVKILKNLGAI